VAWTTGLSSVLAGLEWAPEALGIERSGAERLEHGSGTVVLPLVDGGVYDNDGANALRGARVTHAIVSSADPGDGAEFTQSGPRSLLRLVGVLHTRLGAASRQLTHEMTHSVDPNRARLRLREIAAGIREQYGGEPGLLEIAGELEALSAVGWPPRGHQFSATAPILLCRDDVARNVSARYEAPHDIPVGHRGVARELVPALAGVRTDLDALEEPVFNLLVAQGYFLTDAHLKIAMPELLAADIGSLGNGGENLEPNWEFALESVRRANEDIAHTSAVLGHSARRSLFGRF